VSARVGNAVVRNRVKRLVREIFRERRLDLPAPLDIVVIAKPDAAQITHVQAATELERALEVAPRA
jgi:ribonuclease P protein component